MEIDGRQISISEGTEVYGADGDKVGSVVAVQPNYIVVEKGFFFPTDYYIPMSAIATYDDGRLYLNVAKDVALNQGWETEPTEMTDYASVGGYATDVDTTTTTATGVGYDTDVTRSDVRDTVGMGTATSGMTERVDTGETIRVPVREEELTATKRERELGAVRVETDVVSEERTLEVPITEERVRVERHVVDRPLEAGEVAFQEAVIEVPVRGEEVELQKRVRVAEEVEIGKEAVQRTETVGGTVRREEVRVTENVTDTSAVVDRTTDVVRDSERPV